jgi:hypothetical protein
MYADFTRRLGFEAFALCCLEILQTQQHVLTFGYRVPSSVAFEYEDFGAPVVAITQTPIVLCTSTIPIVRNYAELYARVFPFNTVLEGEYALSRSDPRVQEYLAAVIDNDQSRRRGIVAILGAEAELCFRTPGLEVRVKGACY